MNIHFIYKKNTFNFNIKKDVSISYLKRLVSKVIEKDNSSFDLFYNNKIISEKNGTLSQIEDNKKNMTIIITLKKNNNKEKSTPNNKKIKLPLLNISNRINPIKTESDVKNNLFSNNSEIESDSSLKDLKDYAKTNSRINYKTKTLQRKNEYISKNTVFEDVYNAKEEEIINMMKVLKNKILEYDRILYKNFKNSFDKDNSKLLLYEKNIINYKDNQIKFLKKLIQYFEAKEESLFSTGKINLKEFYIDISNFNNYKTISYVQSDFEKKRKIKFKTNLKLSTFTENKLNNSNKVSEDSIYSDEIIKEKIEKSLDKKPLNFKINNSVTNNTEQHINILNIGVPFEKIDKKNKAKKIILGKDNLTNKENSKQTKKEKNEENYNITKSQSSKSIDTISENKDEDKSLDKNKINILFDNRQKNEEAYSDSDSSMVSLKGKKNMAKLEQNLRERKKTLNRVKVKNYKIGYKVKITDKKKNQKLKKLGNNISDFVI